MYKKWIELEQKNSFYFIAYLYMYMHIITYTFDETMIVDVPVPPDPPNTNITYSPPYVENCVIVFSTPFGKYILQIHGFQCLYFMSLYIKMIHVQCKYFNLVSTRIFFFWGGGGLCSLILQMDLFITLTNMLDSFLAHLN